MWWTVTTARAGTCIVCILYTTGCGACMRVTCLLLAMLEEPERGAVFSLDDIEFSKIFSARAASGLWSDSRVCDKEPEFIDFGV